MEGSDQSMPDTSIQAFQPNDGALSAEHYQTFELAKENDSVLGGTDIAQIRTYAAFARARAQAVHKSIAAMNRLDDVTATKAEMTETAQTFAKVGIYADQRIGEILRELPKSDRWSDLPTGKTDAIKDAGFTPKTAYQLEQLAANPDVVQAVLDKAEADGRIPSRNQVLKAIQERDDARFIADKLKKQRDEAREEVAILEKQNDQLYERANELDAYIEQHPQHPVVERVHTVEVESEAAKKRISNLEHERDLYLSDVQKLRRRNEDMRKELDKAKDMLGMDKTLQDVRKDVQYLISATNQYVRQYGGLTWTTASLEQVDAQSLADLRTAAINLATFANALVASLENFNG